MCQRKQSNQFRTLIFAWPIGLWPCLLGTGSTVFNRLGFMLTFMSIYCPEALSYALSSFQIHRIEKDDFKGRRSSSQSNASMGTYSKASEKFRKKLAELEAQLVLASPSLLFQVSWCVFVRSPYFVGLTELRYSTFYDLRSLVSWRSFCFTGEEYCNGHLAKLDCFLTQQNQCVYFQPSPN